MNLPSWMKTLGVAASSLAAVASTDVNTDASGLERTVERQTIERATEKYYVTPGAPSSTPGKSWDNPTSLRSALNSAADGDSVLVMDGEYQSGGEPFKTDGEHILGGIQSAEERRIDDAYTPDGDPTELTANNTSRVVEMNGGSLTNVRVTGGAAVGQGPRGRGGGITVGDGTTDIKRVLFQNNEAVNGGSALSIEDGNGEVTVVGNAFTNNDAGRGGAVFINGDRTVNFVDNTVFGNPDDSGPEYYDVISEVDNPESITFHAATNTYIADNALSSIGRSPTQVTSGELSGKVTEEGQPLPNTEVTVRDQDTLATATTDDQGRFSTQLTYNQKPITVGFTSGEHVDTDTTTQFTGDQSLTITANRTAYNVDAETNGFIGGTIGDLIVKDGDDTLVDAMVGNETTKTSISTEAGTVQAALDGVGHQYTAKTVSLDGDKNQSLSIETEPWQHTRNIVTETGEDLTVEANGTTLTDQAITQDTTTVMYDITDDVQHGTDLTVAVSNDADTSTVTSTADTTNTAQTITLNPGSDSYTATVNGSTLQEGITLPGAEVIATNIDADTTVADLVSDSTGSFTINDTFEQPYSLRLVSNTSEHQADTTTVDLLAQDRGYTASLDLERRVHRLDLTTRDSTTTNPVSAAGTVAASNTPIAEYTTGNDGETTLEVTTLAAQITIDADTANYDHASTTTDLNGTKPASSTVDLPPIQYTFLGTIAAQDGTGVADATVKLSDADGGSVTTTTEPNGEYALTTSVNDGFEENDAGLLVADKPGLTPDTTTTSTDPDDRTKTRDFTLAPDIDQVTATFNGQTSQEGQTLPNADITIRNADADTTVTSTTSDASGFYETTATYPDNDPYTAQIIADKDEHRADTTNVTLFNNDDTYTKDFDLERLTYRLTINTADSTTGDPLPATGTIKDPTADTTITTYTTGTDGQITKTIQTPINQVTTTADTTNHDPAQTSISLDAAKAVSATTALPPIQYTVQGTVNDANGDNLANTSIDLSDTDDNTITTTTGPNGDYSVTASINNADVEENEAITLTANKPDFNQQDTTLTANPQNRTKTADFTLPETINQVTATVNGTTTQEGTLLPNANITARNADADTTITQKSSNENGDYTLTTSYPDNQAYTLNIISNKPEHQADTASVELQPTSNTYTRDIDLERLIHQLTLNTADSTTGDALPAQGTINDPAADTTITTYTTGTDGQTTITVNTPTDQITTSADTTNYDPTTTTTTLGASKALSITNTLPPIQYTWTGTVTDDNNNALNDATISLNDTDGNQLTATTGPNGDYTINASINDGLQENESITLIADKADFNESSQSSTANPQDRTTTVDFSLSETIINYAVEGNVSSSDGDTVTNTTINLQDPNGTIVDTDQTNTNGSYNTNTTQDELGGDQATLQSNPAGYDPYTESLTLNEGTNTENITLQEILRNYTFDVNQDDGAAITNATVDIDEDEGGQYRDITTLTTGSNGETTTTLSVDEQIIAGDDLRITINKDGYNPTTFTHTVNEENKTFTNTLNKKTVTATITGTTTQEGQTLPNADITFTNADADTTVGSTTSGPNGDYTFTTSYPEVEAYQLDIEANTGDHDATTKTINLASSDETYSEDFDLERLIYDLSINTDDANTNNPINADGNILNNGTSLASYTTGADGQTTLTINTDADNVSSEAKTSNYDPNTQTITLGGTEDITTTNTLPPIEYTFTGNVDGDNGDLNNANITLNDGDGNQLTTTTNSAGDYNISGTINDGLQENETIDITADKTDFNESTKTTTADPDNRTKTTNFTLTPTTVNYTIEGNVTSSDGDTVTNATININEPNGPTAASDNTDNNGFYTASTTQDELGGDQATLQSNPAGYDPYTESLTLNEGTNTENITLQEILRDYQFNTEDANGNTLSNVSLDIDETTTGDRDITTLTTDGSGDASTTLSVDEQIINGDELTFTASKDGYDNAVTTDVVDTETATITLSLQEQTTTYDISGTLTDEDGDQLANKDILIQTTGDNTVAIATTTSDGSYSVSVTQDELGGNTGEVQSNPTGYNEVETTKTFSEGSNTVDLSLPLTEYTRTFDVNDADGNALSNASIDGDETTSGDRDVFTATTNTSGEHTETLTIDDMIVDGDQLEYKFNKDGYNPTTKTETLTDTTKTINANLSEQSTTDRITITFNPKTVGNSLYTGGYSGELDYTVSTDDTTFTTSGSTTADVPITDGDQLEISQSDAAYISTFMVNNTDTEQPPMQVTPYPAEPDYQSTSTVSIDKSSVVNEYQVAGIPDTSPEGYSTINDWKPHLDDSDVRRWTDTGGYSSLETYIQEGHSTQWENKADTVVPEVQSFMPIPIDGPTYITDSNLQDVFNNRNENNITRIDEGADGTTHNFSGDYLQNSSGRFGDGSNYGTVRSEIYNAFTGLDETPNQRVNTKILNDSEEFISDEAQFPIQIIYSTESPTNIQ